MEKEFKLLKKYLKEYINKMKPVLLDYQIFVYGKKGFIIEGHNRKNFPSFEQWKKILK